MMDSSDCYRMIHTALGDWIKGALTHGFEDFPMDRHAPEKGEAIELMDLARLMREIEAHTDIEPPK